MKKYGVLMMAVMMLAGTRAYAGSFDREDFNDPDGAIGVLNSGTDEQQEKAAKYLGDIGHEPATKDLIKVLLDPSDDVREEAARALGKIKSKKAVDPLIARLSDGSSGVRAAAAEALAKIGDPRAIEPMQKQLDADRNPINQIRIRSALEQLKATPQVK